MDCLKQYITYYREFIPIRKHGYNIKFKNYINVGKYNN